MSVSPIRLSLPARILSGVRRVAKCGARCSSRYVSLQGAVPHSYPRKGVQSALDCRIQNAPPPLMPEKAPSASVRPAALGRPRIPPRSSARTARSPLFWLDLLARSCCAKSRWLLARSKAHLLRRSRWLLAHSKAHLLRKSRWLLARSKAHLLCKSRWLLARSKAHLLRKTGLLPSDSSVAPPGSRARESRWNSAALVQFHTCGCKQF
jgi:hypothetical protein